MPNTLIPIQTVTVGSGGTSSIEFTNIPQGYTDLVCMFSLRGTTSQIYILTDIYFNGSTSSFSSIGVEGNGSSAVGYSNPSIYTNAGNGASSTSNTFSSHTVRIFNYTSSSYHKTVGVEGALENNATTAYLSIQAGLWANTSPITSIQIKSRADSFVQNSTATLYGVSNGVKASGGTIIAAGGYAYHTFTSTGSFIPRQQITNAEILVVAGGGGGATSVGGGGGGGGVVYGNSQTLFAGQSYSCVVGAGGTSVGSNTAGVDGSNSIFGTLTSAIGGGGGGSYGGSRAGNPGGSGGGGCGWTTDSIKLGGASTQVLSGKNFIGYGNAGGNGIPSYGDGGSGGGGGAGGAGTSATKPGNGVAGQGGPGTLMFSQWGAVTGTGVLYGGNYYYAGGGGGVWGTTTGVNGGAFYGATAQGAAGAANTGQGGGGDSGSAGGSGIIIVRYPLA